jgi:hypothetical protein
MMVDTNVESHNDVTPASQGINPTDFPSCSWGDSKVKTVSSDPEAFSNLSCDYTGINGFKLRSNGPDGRFGITDMYFLYSVEGHLRLQLRSDPTPTPDTLENKNQAMLSGPNVRYFPSKLAQSGMTVAFLNLIAPYTYYYAYVKKDNLTSTYKKPPRHAFSPNYNTAQGRDCIARFRHVIRQLMGFRFRHNGLPFTVSSYMIGLALKASHKLSSELYDSWNNLDLGSVSFTALALCAIYYEENRSKGFNNVTCLQLARVLYGYSPPTVMITRSVTVIDRNAQGMGTRFPCLPPKYKFYSNINYSKYDRVVENSIVLVPEVGTPMLYNDLYGESVFVYVHRLRLTMVPLTRILASVMLDSLYRFRQATIQNDYSQLFAKRIEPHFNLQYLIGRIPTEEERLLARRIILTWLYLIYDWSLPDSFYDRFEGRADFESTWECWYEHHWILFLDAGRMSYVANYFSDGRFRISKRLRAILAEGKHADVLEQCSWDDAEEHEVHGYRLGLNMNVRTESDVESYVGPLTCNLTNDEFVAALSNINE